METEELKLPGNIADLQTLVVDLYQKNEVLEERERQYEAENKLLREQIKLLSFKIFGSKSEKFSDPDVKQGLLFPEEGEPGAGEEERDEAIQVEAHARRKRGRRPLPANLPRVDVIHDLKEEDKICGCSRMMDVIGQEKSEQLEMIPPQFRVIRHIRLKYGCRHCEGLESDSGAVKIAPLPEQLIPRSFCTPSLLSHIVVSKFSDSIPFYRQEKQLARYGIDLGRATMCNWVRKVWSRCLPLMELLLLELLSGPLIQVDETPFQVLCEEGRTPTSSSYMWVFRGGHPDWPVYIYRYSPRRSGKVASELLGDYRGYVQSDGYRAYNFLDKREDIVHVGCWSHTRRKFTDVVKAVGKKKIDSRVEKALRKIGKLYGIEKEARAAGLTFEELHNKRQSESKKVVDEFEAFLRENVRKVLPESLLGKALSYSLNQMPRLRHFLDDGRIPLDTNLVENAIRPFAVGRKNWLFAYHADGAAASGFFYSLIETARANGLEPHKYLIYLFENLPFVRTQEDYKKLMPRYMKCDHTIAHNAHDP